MERFFKFIFLYFSCLFFVTACWVGLEYVFEGIVHSSSVDGIIAVALSYFMTDKYFDLF